MNTLFGKTERRTVSCSRCGAQKEINALTSLYARCMEEGRPYPWLCDDCFEKRIAEEEAEAAKQDELTEAEWDESVEKTGIGKSYSTIHTPPVRFVAEWLWKVRDNNVILSGQTGTGKTTSVAMLIRELVKMWNRVRYTTLAELCDRWRVARSDNKNPYAISNLRCEIEDSLDYLIIDECADKTVITESTQEFMFRLLDDIASGDCHAKVWLIGNFYKGAVADIFGDEAPAMRRIQENFVCGRINCTDAKVVPIFRR